MGEVSNRLFGIILSGLLVLQVLFGLILIDYPFNDGRYLYNWGPPFWLIQAQEINNVGLPATHFGLKDYATHPQLIGPVIATWTNAFGYSESSIRSLALVLSVLATALLALATREFIGNRRALIFVLFFAALPVIYIYGKKLDQENLVMVFLALHLWGIGLFERKQKLALILVFFGSFGMMLSDWSGAVFAFATFIGVLLVWGLKQNFKKVLTFVIVSASGSFLALFLYLLQTHLQLGGSFAGVLSFYGENLQFRSGQTTEGFNLFVWPVKQLIFVTNNFGIPTFLTGVVFLLHRLRKGDVVNSSARTFAVLVSLIFAGSITYMLVVAQASIVHIYFQYYWSIPIAAGLMFFVEFLTSKAKDKNRMVTWMFSAIVVFLIVAGTTTYEYRNLILVNSWGNRTDVVLLKTIHDVPEDASVIAVNEQKLALDWFLNPNVEYYTGRKNLKGYLFEDGIPFADYILLPKVFGNDVVNFINSGEGYGTDTSATLSACSDNLCLIKVSSNK